ncbi:hypothetical protein DMI66_22575 [Escherichia coli]|nr:hypothetical protein [Escherichia coli]
MTQKIEQSQRQERVAARNRRAECDLAAFQNSPKQTYRAEKRAIANCAPTRKKRFVALVYRTA